MYFEVDIFECFNVIKLDQHHSDRTTKKNLICSTLLKLLNCSVVEFRITLSSEVTSYIETLKKKKSLE